MPITTGRARGEDVEFSLAQQQQTQAAGRTPGECARRETGCDVEVGGFQLSCRVRTGGGKVWAVCLRPQQAIRQQAARQHMMRA